MSSPSPPPKPPPFDSVTGERYTTFDAHLGIDSRPRFHAHAHNELCQTTLGAFGTFSTLEGVERTWGLLASKKGKAKL
ncbi:hypothetical protein FB45DRAFT_1038734 [Roridomyces roridus]|uniref:Uncharacterized protein n=1 Tax=Roridomyces roridus TaxID=1738132 RepID=A0AAD7FAX5_9AGAR|nr:hypothetical protein FB45DRAFT_1038734 [Roridomyces roridus]